MSMNLPPWAYLWIQDHWLIFAGLIAFALNVVYNLVRLSVVNFLKIFQKRPIVVNVTVSRPNATPEQIQEAVRSEVQTLNLRRTSRSVRNRLQAILSDDNDD